MMFGSRLILIALVAVAFCYGTINGQAATAAELTKLALQYGAPFADTDRLNGEIFGRRTAARSTDIIIFNKSSKKFKLGQNECQHGGFTTRLMPDPEIQAKQSSVFQMQSHGFMTGVKCFVQYESDDGLYFSLLSDNPYYGKNWLFDSHSSSLIITSTRGVDNNNQVRWIIEDA